MGSRLAYLRRVARLRGSLLPGIVDPAEELRMAERRLRLGRDSYANTAKVIHHPGDPETDVVVGAYCSIAADVTFFLGGNHRLDTISTYQFRRRHGLPGAEQDDAKASNGPTVVGNDVWIGRAAVIMSGVTIGDGAVVGAHAVVAKDVEPYAIVVGNPARAVRKRFSDEHIRTLLGIRWWDWPEEEVLSCVDVLNGGDVADLARYVRARPLAG